MAGLRVEEGQVNDGKEEVRMADVSGHGILSMWILNLAELAAPYGSRCDSGKMKLNNFLSGCTGLQTLCPRT